MVMGFFSWCETLSHQEAGNVGPSWHQFGSDLGSRYTQVGSNLVPSWLGLLKFDLDSISHNGRYLGSRRVFRQPLRKLRPSWPQLGSEKLKKKSGTTIKKVRN